MKSLFYFFTFLFFLNNTIFSQDTDCESSRLSYLKLYPDVLKSGIDPWYHYLNYGKKEGRLWIKCKDNSTSENLKKDSNILNNNSILTWNINDLGNQKNSSILKKYNEYQRLNRLNDSLINSYIKYDFDTIYTFDADAIYGISLKETYFTLLNNAIIYEVKPNTIEHNMIKKYITSPYKDKKIFLFKINKEIYNEITKVETSKKIKFLKLFFQKSEGYKDGYQEKNWIHIKTYGSVKFGHHSIGGFLAKVNELRKYEKIVSKYSKCKVLNNEIALKEILGIDKNYFTCLEQLNQLKTKIEDIEKAYIINHNNYFFFGEIRQNKPFGFGLVFHKNDSKENEKILSADWSENNFKLYELNSYKHLNQINSNFSDMEIKIFDDEIEVGNTQQNIFYRIDKNLNKYFFNKIDNEYINAEVYFKNNNYYKGVLDSKMKMNDLNGKYVFENGDTYQGSIKDGKFEGLGVYHYSNGNKTDGLWENNKLIKSTYELQEELKKAQIQEQIQEQQRIAEEKRQEQIRIAEVKKKQKEEAESWKLLGDLIKESNRQNKIMENKKVHCTWCNVIYIYKYGFKDDHVYQEELTGQSFQFCSRKCFYSYQQNK